MRAIPNQRNKQRGTGYRKRSYRTKPGQIIESKRRGWRRTNSYSRRWERRIWQPRPSLSRVFIQRTIKKTTWASSSTKPRVCRICPSKYMTSFPEGVFKDISRSIMKWVSELMMYEFWRLFSSSGDTWPTWHSVVHLVLCARGLPAATAGPALQPAEPRWILHCSYSPAPLQTSPTTPIPKGPLIGFFVFLQAQCEGPRTSCSCATSGAFLSSCSI